MNLFSQSLIFLLFGLFTLVLAAGIITMAYYFLLKKYARLEQETFAKEEELSRQTLETLAKAEAEKQQIILEAKTRANELVKEAQSMQKINAQAVMEALKELDLEQAKITKENFKTILQKYNLAKLKLDDKDINMLNNVSKYMEEYRENSLEVYKNFYHEEANAAQQMLEKRIELEHDEIENALAEYKKSQLKKVDENIIKLVSSLINQISTKVINVNEHEDLVIEALEKAKKEGKLS